MVGENMNIDELEKEAEEKTAQYMNEHTEKYNCENTKLETDNYNTGREYGYEDGYIAGAWPRENRIADLEKENTELKTKKIPLLEGRIASIRGCHRVDLAKLNAKTEQVERLKKENAELKEKLKPENCLKSLAKSGLVKFTCENGNEHDQLIKAKEIMSKLYYAGRDVLMCQAELTEDIKQAEQFLKEIEK